MFIECHPALRSMFRPLSSIGLINASFERDDHRDELFVMNVDPSALVGVLPAEGVGQCLQRDAELDEVVEGDRSAVLPIELLDEEIDGGGLKAISHHPQSRRQLALVNEAGAVAIVAAESLLPLRHVIPQLLKFLKINGSGVVSVEHADHLPNGFWVKGRPRAV